MRYDQRSYDDIILMNASDHPENFLIEWINVIILFISSLCGSTWRLEGLKFVWLSGWKARLATMMGRDHIWFYCGV